MEKSEEQSEFDAGWWTLPNVITAIRILGSPILILMGVFQLPVWLGVLALFLVLTEWLDGFLARRLHVESAMGARLDTIADAVFYSSLLAAVACLVPSRMLQEIVWISIAIGSYGCSWLISWFKFGCLPSYHTWMAKAAWVLVTPGIVFLVLGWDYWLFRASMMFVLLTNVEACLISLTLKTAQTDVRSIWRARQGIKD